MTITGSSLIKDITYDGSTLTVTFTNNRVYEYFFVPQETWNSLLRAESKGKFFSTYIRNKFPYGEVK